MHTLFKNATIFDPRDGRFLENAALLVNDDVIEAMEPWPTRMLSWPWPKPVPF
jgi:hypothetical protein